LTCNLAEKHPLRGYIELFLQVRCNLGELSEGGLEVFYDLGGDNVRVG
jgi:hypothetical protein